MAASGPGVVVVAGPPGSGKGTACKSLAKKLGFVHFSLGDVCREQAAQDTDKGKQIKEILDKGEFVPDPLVTDIVKEWISRHDVAAKGLLLDGYPRLPEQAETLAAMGVVKKFVLLQATHDTCVKRALGRRVHSETGELYHMDFVPAPAGDADKLVQRDNDKSEDIVRKRLEVYQSNIPDVTSKFKDKLALVDAEKAPAAVLEAVEKALAASEAADEDDWGDDEVAEVEKMPLEVEISPDADVGADGAERTVMVRIAVPEGENHPAHGGMPALERTNSGKVERAAMDVCCVVDISGSMRSKATYEVDGVQKDDGLTYLDIVKHAAKAVINILKVKDRFTLISFDSRATVEFPLGHMSDGPDGGRAKATAVLEALQPRGTTDIWGGILAGMDALRSPTEDEGWRQKAILLLTDGQPSSSPPEGHVPALKAYKENHPDFSFQLNTFGFGYNLSSELLLDLAVEGSGTFGFIPDALIVGTAFVNSVCNSLSTQTQSAILHLTATGGAEFTGPVIGVGADMVTEASWGRVVSLGPLQFGQLREVALPMKVPAGDAPYLEAVVTYPGKDGKQCKADGKGTSRAGSVAAKVASCRSRTVDAGYRVLAAKPSNEAEADQVMAELKAYMGEAFPADGPENYTALKGDVDGRMTKALDGMDRFNRWGKHYLRALTRAHQIQLCTNFMDAGLQGYGGALFRGLRDEGDQVFINLPPPKPSAAPSRPPAAASGGGSAARSSSPDMGTYYAGSGGG